LRRYETVFIARPDLPDDVIDELIERWGKIITDMKGIVVAVEKWGKRKLAYPISKERKGYYILVDFVGDSAVVTELEKKMKFDDNVLKYLSTKKSEKVDLKETEKEMAAAGQDKSPEDTIPTETVSASEMDKTDVTDSGKNPDESSAEKECEE
jgi:small subunit ribosomal protein S6